MVGGDRRGDAGAKLNTENSSRMPIFHVVYVVQLLKQRCEGFLQSTRNQNSFIP